MVETISTSFTELAYALNICVYIVCILLWIIYLFIFIEQRKAKQFLQEADFRTQIDIARQCMAAAKLSAMEIAILAIEAGMKEHDIYREYLNDVNNRKEYVQRILGPTDRKAKHDMAKFMIEKFPSRFVSHGYAQQLHFVTALPEHRRLPSLSIQVPLSLKEVDKSNK